MAVVDNELDPAVVDAIAYILGLQSDVEAVTGSTASPDQINGDDGMTTTTASPMRRAVRMSMKRNF